MEERVNEDEVDGVWAEGRGDNGVHVHRFGDEVYVTITSEWNTTEGMCSLSLDSARKLIEILQRLTA